MADSSIEWTDKVWNPTRGCSRVSPGCGGAAGEGGCYAERQAYRFSGPGQPYEGLVRLGKQGPRWTGAMRLALSKLDEPTRWRSPSRVFVNSMSDLFHEGLTNEQIAAVFGVMGQCPQHTFQVLTKRAKRMREWFEWVSGNGDEYAPEPDFVVTTCAVNLGANIDQLARPWPLPNVWLGVSAESQEYVDERLPELLTTPAAIRFVSYEPALGPVDFSQWVGSYADEDGHCATCGVSREQHDGYQCPLGFGPFLNWLIVGGESGPGARPFDVQWAEDAVRPCRDAGVACFVKQLGANPYAYDLGDVSPLRLRSAKGGDMSEWPEHLRVREWPRPPRTA